MSEIVGHVARWLPCPIGDRPYCYVVVLTRGYVDDYAAYSAIMMLTSEGDLEWASRHGDKISEQEARLHFPYLPEDAAKTTGGRDG